VKHDLDWDVKLYHRQGSEKRLCGIDVFHEFKWLTVFPDRRTQFKNGQALANFVRKSCPPGKTPALLLTLRDDVKQGFVNTPSLLVCVVNIQEYRRTEGDAALSYIAGHLALDITEIDQLHQLAASADPAALRAFIAAHVDLEHIAAWVASNEERIHNLRELIPPVERTDEAADLAAVVETLRELDDLADDDIALIASLFGPTTDRERRLELLRAVTSDTSGRDVASEVVVERTPQRVEDARRAMAEYQALLEDSGTTETTMQMFIENNLWLLGLDYARMRPRARGPSGAMDFLLERYDGFHDLLELKSPHDHLIKAPDTAQGDPVPPPHDFALSRTLAQALAQAIVYRDRLTRHSGSAEELYGLPHTRDPRLIIIIGRAEPLPEYRQRVVTELNRSLHRIEIIPYDVLAKRANAILGNVEHYLLAANETPED
jgi:hypothetical protein